MKTVGGRWPARVALAVCLAFGVATFTGCPWRAAHTTIVALGSVTDSLHGENQRIYRELTDQIGAENRAAHGTAADYDRLSSAATTAFRVRGEAINALASSLYAAAGINDAIRNGVNTASMRDPAFDILQTLQRVILVLGSDTIPGMRPITLPPQVSQALTFLVSVVGTSRPLPTLDGGASGQ